MARATSKSDLMEAGTLKYDKLNEVIAKLTEKELSSPFDFSDDVKKKEAHWGRDQNLRDVLVHLYEWHQLLLNWVEANQKGEAKSFLPEPYNWRTYGDMNVEFWRKHQETSLEEAKVLFANSHEKVMALAETFTNEELFSKGAFDWVGGTTLGSYFVSATASHYDWAMKKLRAHVKKCQ